MGAWSHHIHSKGTDFLGAVAKIKKGNSLLCARLQCIICLPQEKKKGLQNENHKKRLKQNNAVVGSFFLVEMLFLVISLIYKHFEIRIYIMAKNACKYHIDFLSHY